MKIKKISSTILTLSLCLAPLNSLAISTESMPIEPEIKIEDVANNQEENQTTSETNEEVIQENTAETRGIIYEIVHLSLKLSHANAHRSYTKIVTRGGVKYEVTYKAIPKSECYLCQNDILRASQTNE